MKNLLNRRGHHPAPVLLLSWAAFLLLVALSGCGGALVAEGCPGGECGIYKMCDLDTDCDDLTCERGWECVGLCGGDNDSFVTCECRTFDFCMFETPECFDVEVHTQTR